MAQVVKSRSGLEAVAMTDGPTRELTPDEIVEQIEAMKPRKRKVTIYQSTPRMILSESGSAPPHPQRYVERLALALHRNDYPGTEYGSGRDWPDYPNGTTHDWYLETAEPIAAEYARLAEQDG